MTAIAARGDQLRKRAAVETCQNASARRPPTLPPERRPRTPTMASAGGAGRVDRLIAEASTVSICASQRRPVRERSRSPMLQLGHRERPPALACPPTPASRASCPSSRLRAHRYPFWRAGCQGCRRAAEEGRSAGGRGADRDAGRDPGARGERREEGEPCCACSVPDGLPASPVGRLGPAAASRARLLALSGPRSTRTSRGRTRSCR